MQLKLPFSVKLTVKIQESSLKRSKQSSVGPSGFVHLHACLHQQFVPVVGVAALWNLFDPDVCSCNPSHDSLRRNSGLICWSKSVQNTRRVEVFNQTFSEGRIRAFVFQSTLKNQWKMNERQTRNPKKFSWLMHEEVSLKVWRSPSFITTELRSNTAGRCYLGIIATGSAPHMFLY